MFAEKNRSTKIISLCHIAWAVVLVKGLPAPGENFM